MADPKKEPEEQPVEEKDESPEPKSKGRKLSEEEKSLSEIRTYGEEGSLPKEIPQPEKDDEEEDHPVIERDAMGGLTLQTRSELVEEGEDLDTGDVGDYVTALDPIKARAQSAEAHAKLEALEEV